MGTRFELELDPAVAPFELDVHSMLQCLTNLVTNALDADHLQKVRDARVLREDDHWVLEVDGAGDLTIERMAALARADLLTEVFGRKVAFREAGGRS